MTTQEKNEICAWLLKEWNLSISNDNELLPIYNAFRISNIQLSEINRNSKEFLTAKLEMAINNLKRAQNEINEKTKKEINVLMQSMKRQEEQFVENTRMTLEKLKVNQYYFTNSDSVKEWWFEKIKFWGFVFFIIALSAMSIYYTYRRESEIKLVNNLYDSVLIQQNEYGETYLLITEPHKAKSNETGFEVIKTNKQINGVKIFISNK